MSGVYALYPIRLALAAVFMTYGINKFRDLDGMEAMFDGLGFPIPAVTVFLVATAELLGGLGLFAGVLPRFSAAVLSIVMVTAIVVAKFEQGFVGGWAFDLALLGGLMTVFINGAGRPTVQSIYHELRNRRAEGTQPTAT